MQVVLASSNAGKLAEMSALLKSMKIEIIPQSKLSISDADETGLTFIENALIKARHASALSNMPAIADDSGLVVPALQGAPGLYSARYAGKNATSADNRKKLLIDMKDIKANKRDAYFICVLVFLKHKDDPMPIVCQGIWKGIILSEERGTGGFGYDPVFYVPTENLSAAELAADRKNKISHRGLALQQLIQLLSEIL